MQQRISHKLEAHTPTQDTNESTHVQTLHTVYAWHQCIKLDGSPQSDLPWDVRSPKEVAGYEGGREQVEGPPLPVSDPQSIAHATGSERGT